MSRSLTGCPAEVRISAGWDRTKRRQGRAFVASNALARAATLNARVSSGRRRRDIPVFLWFGICVQSELSAVKTIGVEPPELNPRFPKIPGQRSCDHGTRQACPRNTRNTRKRIFSDQGSGRKMGSEESLPAGDRIFFCPHFSARWPGGLAGRSGGFQPPVGAWKAPLLRTTRRAATANRRCSPLLHAHSCASA